MRASIVERGSLVIRKMTAPHIFAHHKMLETTMLSGYSPPPVNLERLNISLKTAMSGIMSISRAFSCILLACASLALLPVQAQAQSSPSLRDFSLEPQPKGEPPSKVQGPAVDGLRPRDLSQPQQQTAPPQSQPQVQQSGPAPSSPPAAAQPQPDETRITPSRTTPARTATQPPLRPAVTRQQQGAAPAQPANDNMAETQDQAVPSESAMPPAPVTNDTSTAAAPESAGKDAANNTAVSSLPLWVYILGMLALLATLAGLYLRRKDAPAQPVMQTDEQALAPQPSPPASLDNAPKKPAPAPQPQIKQKPKPGPAMPSHAFSSAAGSGAPDGNLAIEFIAESAGATLMNAVLGYRIIVRNGGEAATKLKLSGIMLQATNGSDKVPDDLYQPLHELEKIDAAGQEELKGEIRLPLTQIRPITYNRQALFVPVAHFALEYTDGKGEVRRERHSFIVGREHEPPRAKMAPFRLDLGPRTFHGVGQRPLAV